jgi:hypothetical protein
MSAKERKNDRQTEMKNDWDSLYKNLPSYKQSINYFTVKALHGNPRRSPGSAQSRKMTGDLRSKNLPCLRLQLVRYITAGIRSIPSGGGPASHAFEGFFEERL